MTTAPIDAPPVLPGAVAHTHGDEGTGPAPIPSGRDLRAAVPLRDTQLATFPLPTGREEEWRFTPLDRLRGLHDGTGAADGKVVVEVTGEPGVTVEVVDRTDPRLGRTGSAVDRIAAQAWASFDRATVVTVPSETVLTQPVVVSVRGEAGGGAAFGHLLLDIGAFASATVVLECTGSATYADNVEIRVGDSAQLTVVTVYDWAEDAVHVSSHTLLVGRDARLKSVIVSLGGDLVRVSPTVTYAGSGGDAELLGLYFADAGQHLEHRLFVDHAQPSCRSNVLYKGALQGRDARTVWVGDVHIRAHADGTDTYEHNRNLLLTEGTRADSVPNLEIETGEIVGAGHASATGRFDDEQLFYFMSRGISETEARRLVVRGFFAELVARIGVAEVEDRVMTALEAELALGTPGAGVPGAAP